MRFEKPLYFDQAATSFPKAPGVSEAMRRYIDEVGANVNRSTYDKATEAADALMETRDLLCRLFHFTEPACAVFTPGQTYSLNFVLKGYLSPGEQVVTSGMEHNAVMRPLTELSQKGVRVVTVPAQRDGSVLIADFDAALTADTKLCVVTAASNVCGTLLPVTEIAALCRKRGIPLCLDAAQTAGRLPIDMGALGLAALCVPGHKGLLGPQGVGALLLHPDFADRLSPLILGGTGSASDSLLPPPYMPDRFEAGTLNLPGVYGLRAALRFIGEIGVERLYTDEKRLTQRFLDGLTGMPNVRLIGKPGLDGRVAVVSILLPRMDQGEAAFRLEQEFGVLTRAGLHCAPAAHQSLGTFPAGTIRFSFGFGNTEAEIDLALTALRAVSAG